MAAMMKMRRIRAGSGAEVSVRCVCVTVPPMTEWDARSIDRIAQLLLLHTPALPVTHLTHFVLLDTFPLNQSISRQQLSERHSAAEAGA